MGGQPARVDRAQVSFESVNGNVLHVHIASPAYTGDQYLGYGGMSPKYWMNLADNTGTTSFGTSTDGRVYSGMTAGSHPAVPFTTTFSTMTATEQRIHEVDGTGGTAMAMDTVCTH